MQQSVIKIDREDDSSALEEHDGCSFLCPKILESDIKEDMKVFGLSLNKRKECVFNNAHVEFEKIIKLSQMSLIDGLTDTLFKEFCRNHSLGCNKQQFVYNSKQMKLDGTKPTCDWSSCCQSLLGYYYIDWKNN